MLSNKKVLFVDDERSVLNSLRRSFNAKPYECYFADNAESALEILARHEIAVIVSDQRMPHMTGHELLTQIQDFYPLTQRIILSGYSNSEDILKSINHARIHHYMMKPWEPEDLFALVEKSIVNYIKAAQELSLRECVSHVSDAIIITDHQFRILHCNQALTLLSGFETEQLIGKNIKMLGIDVKALADTDHQVANAFIFNHYQCTRTPVYVQQQVLPQTHQEQPYYSFVIEDVSLMVSFQNILSQAEDIEPLTQTLSRNQLISELNNIKHKTSYKNFNAIMLLDVCNMSKLNHIISYQQGDLVIKAIAKYLIQQFGNQAVARIADNTFAVLYNQHHDDSKVHKITDNLANHLQQLLPSMYICRFYQFTRALDTIEIPDQILASCELTLQEMKRLQK